LKALFIDDDESLNEFIVGLLMRQGFNTEYYSTLLDARSACFKTTYDLAILDLMFPPCYGQEGLDLIPLLKKNNPNIYIIMISGREDRMTDIVSSAHMDGIYAFIDKNSLDFTDRLANFVLEGKQEMSNKIFISHGHNDYLKLKLKDFLNNKLKRETIILSELPKRGHTIVEQLENASKFCNSAIILLTRDDEMLDSGMRARQNVVHEIGFFQGKYGRENVVLVAEKGLDLFSNISGILRIEFDLEHFEEVFEDLRNDLNQSNS